MVARLIKRFIDFFLDHSAVHCLVFLGGLFLLLISIPYGRWAFVTGLVFTFSGLAMIIYEIRWSIASETERRRERRTHANRW